MYAIVKVGGHQYRVEEGDSLLVDRLSADEGATVELEPVLFRDDDPVLDRDELAKVKVSAVVSGHERGEKVHVLKFKPKRGYKRRMGHRSDLTRLEVREIKKLSRKRSGSGKKAGDGAKGKAASGTKGKAGSGAKDKAASGAKGGTKEAGDGS
jgi:large subunit ribosomal protein L21